MGIAGDAALAAVPIAAVFLLMVVARWPASRAAPAGLAVALLLAWGWFGFDTGPLAREGRTEPTLGATAEALFSSATILWILIGALAIHQLQERSGGTERIRATVAGLTSDPRQGTLIVAWFFALFIEGAAGFGTPVALAAPLLLTFGVRPIEAVTIALLGHAIGVSFGAVGTPVLTQATITGFEPLELARTTAVYHAVLGTVMLVFMMAVAGRALPAAADHVRAWPWIALAAVCFLAPSTVLARWLGPELPTLGGALIGSGVFVGMLLLWRRRTRDGRPEPAPTDSDGLPLVIAAAPYLVLIGLVVITRMIVPIREGLQNVVLEWELFGGFSGSVQPLYHPGTLLLVSFVAGGAIQRVAPGGLLLAVRAAAIRVAPVTIALVAMLGLSRLMVHSGMTSALAIAAAEYVGAAWPLIAPSVGVLGTFTTGSATSSNVLFSDFQLDTAEQLDLSAPVLLGSQSAGAAVGNVIAPHNIIPGAATVGMRGGEGEVLRKTVPACTAYATGLGILAFFWSRA